MAKKLFPSSIDGIHHQFNTESGDSKKEAEAAVKEFSEKNFGTAVFPLDVYDDEYWIMFSPFEYSRSNRSEVAQIKNSSQASSSSTLKGNIILPLPADLSTGYGANYSQETMGIPGVAIAAATDAVKGMWNDIKNGKDFNAARKDVSADIMTVYNAGAENAAGAAAAGALAVDDFFGSGVSLALGVQRNPHLAVLFEGVGFRQHRFSYKFTPKNDGESVELFNIIKIFKAAMHPSYMHGYSNHLFKYPDEWDITFAHPQFKIGPSVLLDFQVNYHGQGVPSYFRDHQPTTISISMVFQETSIVTKEDVLTRGR